MTFEYGRGEVFALCGDKLPESTGDKLPESTGEDNSTLLGETFQTVLGEWLHWGVRYSTGEQSYIKTVGDACLGNICILRQEILRSSGDAQLP